jgi:hypothetical protein
MTDRTMEELMELLDPYLDNFDQIGRSGVSTYRRYPPEFLIEHDPRAQASCIYCHMNFEAERLLAGRKGIVPKEIRGLKIWLIGDHSVIRLKRMDEDGHTRNYPTKQARDYDRGVQFPELPPPAARLSVGYFLDPTQTQVIRVQIARPMGKRIVWCAAIVPADKRVPGAMRWYDATRQKGF